MEKFLKKILLYLLLPTIYIGMNTFINYQILKNLKPKIQQASILILGDSHFRRAINPDFFESAVNVSMQGEPYYISYWKLKELYPIVRPDTVFLAFSPYNIGGFNDLKLSNPMWANMMFEWYYPIEEFHNLTDIKINYRQYFRVLLRQFGYYPHYQHLNYIGKYTTEDEGISRIHNFEDVINRQYYDNDKVLGVSETTVNYLDSLIDFCHLYQISPVLIGTPVHPSYFNLIPSPILNRFEIEKKRMLSKGVKVIDKTQHFYPDSCYLDADHLNSKGSKLFMDTLVKELNTL